MRTLTQAMFIVAASAFLFACKPKDQAPEPVASAAEDAPAEEPVAEVAEERVEACNLTVTAPEAVEVTTYWNKDGGSASRARSIHWANAEEKAAQPTTNPAPPLEIVCGSNDSPRITISLVASQSTDSDVPMSSGSYPIIGKLQAAAVKAGQFELQELSYDGRNFDSRSGTLTVSSFDSRGVEGSFTIDGVEVAENGPPIHVEGTFEIPCHGGSYESECRPN
jgi:hypothetical protein